ncbi:Aste57867_12124 [Aphanomyces stellatus]|uniref:Aste57867_12124 protein n=1 Tax=Aphanomyces stellatus TaxID=120398 RepID=A0A485KWR2_9STRA|nr:hypothetical protein As57867_012079 [Aphanomyces stellatus]VFT88978.1 Aste57867_12124 [Aphanomyces stellatus]
MTQLEDIAVHTHNLANSTDEIAQMDLDGCMAVFDHAFEIFCEQNPDITNTNNPVSVLPPRPVRKPMLRPAESDCPVEWSDGSKHQAPETWKFPNVNCREAWKLWPLITKVNSIASRNLPKVIPETTGQFTWCDGSSHHAPEDWKFPSMV